MRADDAISRISSGPARLSAASLWSAALPSARRAETLPSVPSRAQQLALDAVKVCEVCGDDDDEPGNDILLCEAPGCHRGYHMWCLTPKLTHVPRRQWLCPDCAASTARAASATAAEAAAEAAVRPLCSGGGHSGLYGHSDSAHAAGGAAVFGGTPRLCAPPSVGAASRGSAGGSSSASTVGVPPSTRAPSASTPVSEGGDMEGAPRSAGSTGGRASSAGSSAGGSSTPVDERSLTAAREW